MTWLVSHQHNGAPVTTAHATEAAAGREAGRVSAGLPTGATVVYWFADEGAEGSRKRATGSLRAEEGKTVDSCVGGFEGLSGAGNDEGDEK